MSFTGLYLKLPQSCCVYVCHIQLTYLLQISWQYVFYYGTVQAQVYTRVRVKRRALAWRDVQVFQVLDKAFTREVMINIIAKCMEKQLAILRTYT